MADYIQSLDPRSLVVLETVLSFSISAFTAPAYNLPIFLFGAYTQESSDANQSLKLFTGLLGGSLVFDIIYMIRNKQGWLVKTISILILLLKVPTFFAFVTALRQRGEQFSGLNIRGSDITGPTVWSMPGGFSSLAGRRGGYEDLDSGRDAEAHPRPNPAAQPGKPTPPAPATPTQAPAPAPKPAPPGSYQAA